jgi:hypothetical protein
VRHGKEGEREFGGERMVKVMRNNDGDNEWRVTYHMTDAVKITMTEKADLVDRQVDMLESVKKTVGDKVKLMHVTMFPRFLKECFKTYMTDLDVWLLDGVRRDVSREI